MFNDPTKRRWIGWGALAIVFLLVNIHRLSSAVLSEELQATFQTSAAQLGTLHAAFFYIYAIVQIPTGLLADRVGPRYVGAAGAAVLSVGAILFALSDSYLAAFAARALIGLGSGVIFISMLRFSANWFRPDEFATMTGLTAGIAGLGAILATTPLALAVSATGWQPTIILLGIVGFLAAAGVFVFARNSPSDAGLAPIDGVPERPTVTTADARRALRQLAGDIDQWLLSIVFFSAMGTLLTLLGLWGVPYLVVVHDLDLTTASYYTLLGSVGMLFGAPVIGRISDRIGKRIVPMIVGVGLLMIALSIIPIFGRPPLAVVALTYIAIGFFTGAAMLSLSIIKERYPGEASGVATATVNTAGFVGGALFPTLMGVALDTYQQDELVGGTVVYTEFGYRVAFAIVTVAVAAGFLCAIAVYIREHRRQLV